MLASPPSALNWSTQGFHHRLCRSRPGLHLHPSQAPKPASVLPFGLLHRSIAGAGLVVFLDGMSTRAWQHMETVSWSVTGGPGAMHWLTAAPQDDFREGLFLPVLILGHSFPWPNSAWHSKRNTKCTLSVSFLKAHFACNAFSRADNYICHLNSFILFMSLKK